MFGKVTYLAMFLVLFLDHVHQFLVSLHMSWLGSCFTWARVKIRGY